jgi:hypothetical protein
MKRTDLEIEMDDAEAVGHEKEMQCEICKQQFPVVSQHIREEDGNLIDTSYAMKFSIEKETGMWDYWEIEETLHQCCQQCYETKIKPLFQDGEPKHADLKEKLRTIYAQFNKYVIKTKNTSEELNDLILEMISFMGRIVDSTTKTTNTKGETP